MLHSVPYCNAVITMEGLALITGTATNKGRPNRLWRKSRFRPLIFRMPADAPTDGPKSRFFAYRP